MQTLFKIGLSNASQGQHRRKDATEQMKNLTLARTRTSVRFLIVKVSLYLYVPDEGSLLPKYRDCTTFNVFELYLMCCGVMLLLLIIYKYIQD